jgi:hypothetical protein
MPLTSRPRNSTARRTLRPTGPSCRGGASSLLRLAQPLSGRLPSSVDVGEWVSRAASALLPVSAAAAPNHFAPSQFTAG